jgi:hypothetical protein
MPSKFSDHSRSVISALMTACALVFMTASAAGSTYAQSKNMPEAKRNDRPQGANPNLQPGVENRTLDATQYSYEFKQPQFIVKRILIEHDASGRGNITFERQNEDAPIVEKIGLSTAALGRILGLWSQLNFLDSTENYQSSRNFAHLGVMRITMANGDRKRTAEFNWSDNKAAWNLVTEYRRVADQAILIFNIGVAREIQPLNAPQLMDELEMLYTRNGLSDPQQLVPLLKDMVTDEHIPLIARNHANRLLKKIVK